ncbi:MAG: RidA family protein [Mycobacteriales bacterium]
MNRRISSDSAYADLVGYARAVVAGPFVFVSGCTSTVDGAYEQTLAAFAVAERALAQAGLGRADVVRTRMYVTDIGLWEEVGRAHRELFDAVRPATTMLQVSALIDPRMLVEVEVDAYRESAS